MSEEDEVPDNSDKTILSVDDDPVNQMVISSLFEAEGYNVAQAMDGFEALEYMKTNACPDIILLDVMMPGLSGYDVLDKLREEYTPDLPVIMISAKASLADRVEGLQHLCNDYQTKPFEKNELLQRVASWVALRRQVESSHESSKSRSLLIKTAPAGLVATLLKERSTISKLENVITLVIYIDKVREILETHAHGQMKFLQFMKIVAKFSEGVERILHSKEYSCIFETTGPTITIHFTEFLDIMAGCRYVTSILNEIIVSAEKYNIYDKVGLDQFLRLGMACGRGVGGIVAGRYAIVTPCFIEALILAEKGVNGFAHVSNLVRSAANIQTSHTVERGKFNGRTTYIIKRQHIDTPDNLTSEEDFAVLAGISDASSESDEANEDSSRNVEVQVGDDETKIIDSEEVDCPPIPEPEPPIKAPEPIVRRRGDMIREELRKKIELLMLENRVATISGNSMIRYQRLQAMYGPPQTDPSTMGNTNPY